MWRKRRKRKFDFSNPKIYRTTAREVNKTFNPIYLWIILSVILIGAVVYWLFYSDFFKIKNIEIEGEVNNTIKNKINEFYGKNIFLFTIGQQDKQLAKEQTSIEKLNIIKGIPDTLKIDVLVRKPVIRWKTQDKILFIDQNGIIFNLDSSREEDNQLPIVFDSRNLPVTLGSKIVPNDFIGFVEKTATQVPQKVGKEIEEMKIDETTLHLEIKFKDSFRVYLDTMNSWDDQIKLLQKAIEKHDKEIKEYVDLRVANKAYYK